MKWVVFDGEADGFTPSKFYCVCYHDSDGNRGVLTSYDEIRKFFNQTGLVYVGHNIRRWDLIQLRRVVGIKSYPVGDVIDSLGLSWYLYPDRVVHSLESYGVEYGIHKKHIANWDDLELSQYVERCQIDVEINTRMFKEAMLKLRKIYKDPGREEKLLKYLDFKLYSAALAEQSRWRLDVEETRKKLERLKDERDKKVDELREAMPLVEIVQEYKQPARLYNADGQLSILGQRWKDRVERAGLSEGYSGVVSEVIGLEPGNPGSHQQIKEWLYSLGWVPRTFKTNKKREEVPQINKEFGGGICDSIKELYEKEPRLEVLDGLSVLNHRIGLLSGFLRDMSKDGYLTASVAGLTNTLRFKHAVIVNLPKPEVKLGKEIRSSLIPDSDTDELCGSDMASVEDRIKQHYIYRHDPDYVKELNTEGYDPHLDLGKMAGKISPSDVLLYKELDAKAEKTDEEKKKYSIIKKLRSIFKNGNYACQYGAFPPRLQKTCNITLEEAEGVYDAYWKRNWAIKAVADEQIVKTVDGQSWLLNPVSGLWYSLRNKKDIFSTLVQGTAAYVFDVYLGNVLRKRPQITGQFHDEFILNVKKGNREAIKKFLDDCIKETNKMLNLNRELGISVQFGDNYAEIH
jgi:hypothetical protein